MGTDRRGWRESIPVPARGPGRRAAGAAVTLLSVAVAGGAAGQAPARDLRLWPAPPQASVPLNPGTAFLASALAPGAGQYLQKADRWVPYAVLEVWAWITFLDRRRDSRDLSRRYRDLAWSVARRVSTGARRDTVFDYYETMSRFAASGSFDADLQRSGVQPDPDSTTFNGDLWLLARALFFPGGAAYPEGSPEYQRALGYYQRHAIPSSFAWAWGDSNLEQRVFGELMRGSDGAYRTATQLLAVIMANHLVSAIDALVLARLERASAASLTARFESGLEWDRGGRWSVGVRLGW